MSFALALLLLGAQDLLPVATEGQPLSVNAGRLVEALEFLGRPLPEAARASVRKAKLDGTRIQEALDPHVHFEVRLDGGARRGPAKAILQQGGWTPLLIKVINPAGARNPLEIRSPQSGPVYSGGFANPKGGKGRFLQVEMFRSRPMTSRLSGATAEYAIALVYSSEAGKREAEISLGGPAVKVSFDIRPGISVKLSVKELDGTPTAGRFTFTDQLGHVYPPQPKRLAPDFFFQKQIYRHHGGTVLLPPGELTMSYGRGPEYKLQKRQVTIPEKGPASIDVVVERWVNPMEYGFYGGDHHIHASGCAHYTEPTVGVHAPDMFLHVKGEGLNVGCNLTWGPGFEYQRQFFSAEADKVSEPFTVLKYDIEVSGFGSQRLGHVCLLNLKEQYYPGSEGTKTKGWPSWTTPLMKWAKAQGAVTGYAHSANGLRIIAANSAGRLVEQLDADGNGTLSGAEGAKGLLPEPFGTIDEDENDSLDAKELTRSVARASRKLPNYAIPEMNGIGAQEICVTVAQGLCDFISAMDTDRMPEWNCWYHLMNCGFPLKVSGETDFPCITGGRVGEGRVYVQLGGVEKIVYADWCKALAEGRSYVSDGYAHALEFTVNGKPVGETVALDAPGEVDIKASVTFGKESPLGSAPGGFIPRGKTRKVELIVNGRVAKAWDVEASGDIHHLIGKVRIDRSSWVALRQFPQLHTNPVNVIVGGKPIRASRKSALWCIGVIEQLWRVRARAIAEHERPEAEKTFKWAIEQYRRIAAECPEGS